MIEKFVVSFAMNKGPFMGMWLETDVGKLDTSGLISPHTLSFAIDIRPPSIRGEERATYYPRRLWVDLEPYYVKLREACDTLLLDQLTPHHITILDGKVQVHPDIADHWRCPFCHPKMADLYHGRETRDDDT